MIPILYAKNASDFSNNGIGILKDAISCEVSEERNGSYSLTLKYPISGNWFSSIGEGSIVKAKPNEISDPQLFRIRKSSKPIKGTVTFYADHISYDLSGLPVMGLTMASTTPGAAMTEAIEASPIQSDFTAWSDIGTLRGIDITEPRSVRALIGGQAGSVLSIWGGELEFDNFIVKLHSSRGSNNGVILNYGKNITDAKQERNIESCYTHFCPYAVKTVNTTSASGEIIDQQKITVKLSEEIIELVDPHDIGHSRALILDMSDQFGEGEEITEAALRIKAEEYIESHELGTPEVNITVKFVQIWDTPEYESFAALERVRLCDVVTVRFEELGISATAKVIKTVYDVLKERYSSIEIGSAKESLADSFESVEGQIKETSETVSENKSAQEAALNNAIIEAANKITGNAGGYVVLHPENYPSEILIMNTNDINTATKVWRWNSSGLGYSSNGYAGTYGLAMTIDGSIVADYITTGTLTAINISGCSISGGTLNIGSGKFQVDSSGNIHAEGFIKATSGEIGGCSIVNGVLQVPAARITGTLTASQIDATNLHVSAANITGTLVIGQLPSTVAEISDIPTNNNQLTNGAGYQTSANVVSIIDGRITAAYIEALSISVGAAQITGKLTASQINADGITASNVTISGAVTATSGSVSELTVAGKLYFGNNRNYYLNANYNDSSYYIKLPGFQVDDASGAVFSGKLNAPSGNIGGCSIVNGVLQVPVANIIGSITATALEVKSGSYTYFKAGDGAVQIGGFNVNNNSIYSGSTFSNSAVFLCTGSTGYLTIGGHYGTSWGLKVGTKFGVNTSGELYCTSAHLSGSIEATSGTFHSGCVLGANLQIREWKSDFTALCTQGMTLPSSLGDAPTAATAGMILISSADTATGVLTFRSASSRSNISANTFEIYDTGSNAYTKRLYFHSGDIQSYSQGILNYSLDSYYSSGDNYVLARGEWRIGGTRSSGSWYHSLKANIANSSAGGGGALLGTWTGTVSSGSGSDRNIKHNIEDMPEAYEKLFDDLHPVRFKYDDGTSDRYHTGFIAQEVKAATEAAGLSTQDFAAYYTFERQISETEYVTTAALRYGEFVSLNTWEIQKLKAKIKALEERISALEG